MAKIDNLDDFLKDIANTIREKKGTNAPINAQDFSSEIASISTGSGETAAIIAESEVNFRDYDGTLLHSFTKVEFLALTKLPDLPTQPGLVCQEWNWSLEDAQSYVQKYDRLEVGATYITDDGKTRLYISILNKSVSTIPLYFSTGTSGINIDWGDGSYQTLTSLGTYRLSHAYDRVGDFVITIDVGEETGVGGFKIDLGTSSSGTETILGNTSSTRAYTNSLTKIELGNGHRTIDAGTFQACANLRSITIPKYVTMIGDNAFKSCSALGYIALPRAVSSIGTSALASMSNIRTFSLPKNIATLGDNVFQYAYGMTQLVLPPNISSIPQQLYAYNYSTRMVHIPASVTNIYSGAFRSCSALAKVVIHGSPKIAPSAFDSCTGVSEYRFIGSTTVPTIYSSSLTVPSFCKIVVPDSLYESWKKASNWSTYASLIVKESEYTD